jgi:RNA polymerase sigma-70 factor (ECF subfamily)
MLRTVSTALQTEERAFESLYRLHRPVVYAYALSTLRNVADAEDATQTTFMNAYCALHRGVYPRDEAQWLLAIGRNVCRDKFREAKRRPAEVPLLDWGYAAPAAEPEYSVAEVSRELSGLNPRHRKILLMREFEGRSYAEISELMGVSEPAVQALLRRARRALRDELQLGMTCAQARRTVMRDMAGLAVLEERRALQKHLRRCADCSEAVGRRARSPLTHALWLTLLPFRRMGQLLAGSASAPATPGIAAKIAALTVVGTTTVGVTAHEISTDTSSSPGGPAPRQPVASPEHAKARVQVGVAPAAPVWVSHRVGVLPSGKVLVHGTHKAAPVLHQAGSVLAGSGVTSAAPPSSSVVADPTAASAPVSQQPSSSFPATPPAPDASSPVSSEPAGTDAQASDPVVSAPAAASSAAGSAIATAVAAVAAPAADASAPTASDQGSTQDQSGSGGAATTPPVTVPVPQDPTPVVTPSGNTLPPQSNGKPGGPDQMPPKAVANGHSK